MKIAIKFTLLFCIQFGYSQATEKYTDLLNQLTPVKTEKIEEYFKNGNIKRRATITYYNIIGEEYGVYSGKYIKYFKNGNISWERDNDKVGAPLSFNLYSGGEIISSKTILELDTNSDNVEDFLYNRRNTSYIYEYKEYENNTDGEKVVRLTGVFINNKKSGVWKTFRNGELKKIKTYKEQNKFENLPKTRYVN